MDWAAFLKQHPVFSSLPDAEIDRLLQLDVSNARHYDEQQTVFRIGESGDSIFLIGSGSVRISLPGADNKAIPLIHLRKGEFFGEIAVFDRRPRSATAITAEPCELLEIKGTKLLDLAHDHPQIEFKFLMHLSSRLRDVGDQVMAVTVKEVDEKIKAVNARLDAELKVIDASLKASQTVFDHTSKRAGEVIESVERSRSRMTIVASLIGGGLSTIVAVFGLIGFSELQNIKEINKEAEEIANKIEQVAPKVEKVDVLFDTFTDRIKKADALFNTVSDQIQVFQKDLFSKVLLPRFTEAINEDLVTTLKIYQQILAIDDPEVDGMLFRQIMGVILGYARESQGSKESKEKERQERQRYAQVLNAGITEEVVANHRQAVLSYYLLLTALALKGGPLSLEGGLLPEGKELKFEMLKQQLEDYLKDHSDPVKFQFEQDFGTAVMEQLLEDDESLNLVKKIWQSLP